MSRRINFIALRTINDKFKTLTNFSSYVHRLTQLKISRKKYSKLINFRWQHFPMLSTTQFILTEFLSGGRKRTRRRYSIIHMTPSYIRKAGGNNINFLIFCTFFLNCKSRKKKNNLNSLSRRHCKSGYRLCVVLKN